MRLKNLALDVESIALCLSEEGGYEYYDIDDDLKELAKNVSDMEAENSKLRKLAAEMYPYAKAFLQEYLILGYIDSKSYDWYLQLREMGIEVDE